MNLMKENSYILLEFRGRLNGPLLDQLLASLQWSLEESELSMSLRKRVFSVALECFQNVYRYSPQLTHSVSGEVSEEMAYSEANLAVRVKNGQYVVTSGNALFPEQAKSLVRLIESVNHASAEELKFRYNEALQNYSTSNQRGAGLGLMDMKRKSNAPLNYRITQKADQFWFELELQLS
jgi:hypothetical protein